MNGEQQEKKFAHDAISRHLIRIHKLWMCVCIQFVKQIKNFFFFHVLNRIKSLDQEKKTFVRVRATFFFFRKVAISIRSEWVCEKRANVFICKGQQTHTHLGEKRSSAKKKPRIEKKKHRVINRRQPNLDSLCSRSLNSSVCILTHIHVCA